jgi:hypothetical protein
VSLRVGLVEAHLESSGKWIQVGHWHLFLSTEFTEIAEKTFLKISVDSVRSVANLFYPARTSNTIAAAVSPAAQPVNNP